MEADSQVYYVMDSLFLTLYEGIDYGDRMENEGAGGDVENVFNVRT